MTYYWCNAISIIETRKLPCWNHLISVNSGEDSSGVCVGQQFSTGVPLHIWVYELSTGVLRRVTGPLRNMSPPMALWCPLSKNWWCTVTILVPYQWTVSRPIASIHGGAHHGAQTENLVYHKQFLNFLHCRDCHVQTAPLLRKLLFCFTTHLFVYSESDLVKSLSHSQFWPEL